jgi:hypothetical protein
MGFWGVIVRAVTAFVLLFVVLLESGCTIWDKETRNRGGYLDYVLDEHWMQADSKRMRALRAFAIEVSLARIASVSNQTQNGRDVLAAQIKSTTTSFIPVYACAIAPLPTEDKGTEKNPCFYYDSAMVDYTTGLFNLAMSALPVDDAKNLINTLPASAVSPIAWSELLHALLVIGRDAITLGRVAGALYRDTVELEVQLWLATPAIDTRPAPYNVTEEKVAHLREVYARGNDDMPEWLGQIEALHNLKLEPYPDPVFFNKLNLLLNYVCTLLTKDATACQVEDFNAALAKQPPAVQKLAAAAKAATPAIPKPAPIKSSLGSDPNRDYLKRYLQTTVPGLNDRLAALQTIFENNPQVAAAIKQDEGSDPPPPTMIVVDADKYKDARSLIVPAACANGLFKTVTSDPKLQSQACTQ